MIYFVENTATNELKIGYTRDETSLVKRMKTFKCGNPSALNILLLIDGCRIKEGRIHREFTGLRRVNSEWFNYCGNLRLFVERTIANNRETNV
jgi:Meiotically up-regulated gene 113